LGAFKTQIVVARPTKQILRLPEEITFFELPSMPNAIFIRNSYVSMFEKVQEAWKNKQYPIIRGTPGIGKSHFLLYCFWRLAKDPDTESILVQLQTSADFYLWRRVKVDGQANFHLTYSPLYPLNNVSETTYYLTDTTKPHNDLHKTLMVSSPDYHHTASEFKKRNARKYWFTVWDEEELQHCRRSLYQSLSIELVSRLFVMWGGVPRYVLQEPTDRQEEFPSMGVEKHCAFAHDLITTFVLKIEDFKTFKQALQQSESKSDLTHSILHHIVIEDEHTGGQKAVMDVGTRYIMDIIVEKQEGRFVNEMLEFVTHVDAPIAGSLRGYAFEILVHRRIIKGTLKCNVHPLPFDSRKDKPIAFNFPTNVRKVNWGNYDEISNASERDYYRPVSHTFESVDSFMAGVGFLQVPPIPSLSQPLILCRFRCQGSGLSIKLA
jgi:hypothetical protein